MWLLDTTTLRLRSFVGNIPHYAILSHTWADEEVTFDDIHQPRAPQMAGYRKIVESSRRAQEDGFEWIWIDTCCIDKRSSSELSEAINSMYQIYWNAALCYAFLSDVVFDSEDPHFVYESKCQIEESRWFTRGWTLQELLAPVSVEFYDENWHFLGTKCKLINMIHTTTKIEPKFIIDRETIQGASIATKMSWAASRQTTRPEDMAYCLLGLIGVNMPMLYGEGHKAFYRLQLEIIRQNNDHSIFAWEPPGSDWQATAVLAPSPRCFAHSARFNPIKLRSSADAGAYEVTNNGLRITLPVIRIDEERSVAFLNCENSDGEIVSLWVEKAEGNVYRRLPGSKLAMRSTEEEDEAQLQAMYLVVNSNVSQEVKSAPHLLSIGAIYAEGPWFINGIAVYTQRTFTVNFTTSFTGLPKWRAPTHLRHDPALQYDYLTQILSLQSGELVSFRIEEMNSLKEAWSNSHVQILVGLRGSRPVVRMVWIGDHHVDRQWAQDMMINKDGSWNAAGDWLLKSVEVFGAWTSVEVVTKTSVRAGSLHSCLYIKLRKCTCFHEPCTCYTEERVLKDIGEYCS